MFSLRQRQTWAAAFARQALSDLHAREAIVTANLPDCQSLHFLQMAAEKVCKAHLYAVGEEVGFTHAVVRKYLPVLVRELSPEVSKSSRRRARIKVMSRLNELLAPNLDYGGSHPENTEYPWRALNGDPVSPLDFEFAGLQDEQEITFLVKIIQKAAKEYVPVAGAKKEEM